MESPPHPVFADLEQDAEASVAEAFARIAVEYFAATRSGEGRVSTAHGPDELARRFDEPLPRAGPADRGRPRAAAPGRDPRLEPPLPPALDGPPGLGAAAGRGLDGVARRRAQPVGRGLGDVAGGHHPGGARHPLDVRPRRARPRGRAARSPRAAPRPRSPRSSPRGRRRFPRRGRRASAPRRRSSSTASTRTTRSRARWASWASAPTTRWPSPRAASGWTWTRSRRSSIGSRPGGGRSWRWSRRPARPRPARSTTSRRSAACARRAGCGSTWTAPTGPPRSSRRRTATGCAGSSAPARSPGTRTR